jgi:hypothetical protein
LLDLLGGEYFFWCRSIFSRRSSTTRFK